ncbi:hypothetical protein SAMN05216315_14217 [Nitrosospira sp. Nsp18]|uniref:HK97 family phage prohead protease n=1 Tax=Nitrosospira sp. Nsp18 TaxID=1855334 RepID=UPI0008808ED7|nr:HK97 family phage prohead protease [Nitrosospira sp. Nsp18]SDA29211.1 hypothetical protein SAMN05216315_14217 [Nitrosospira sp. Nsp18]
MLALNKCDLKFANTEGEFTGYGSVFGVLDSKNDVIMPGAYAEVLKSSESVKVYVNHGWMRGELPIGTWSGLKEDGRGLKGTAGLVMQMPSAVNAYWSIKSGLVSGLSVAIMPDHNSIERRADGARVIHNIKALKEISIVTDPANDESRVLDVKFSEEIEKVGSIREFECLLRDVGGLDRGTAKQLVTKAKELFAQRDAGDDVRAKESSDELATAFMFRLSTFGKNI